MRDCHIGARLVDYRQVRHLTQQAVADTVEMSRSDLSRIETGARLPTLLQAMALAELFAVDLDTLCTGTSPYRRLTDLLLVLLQHEEVFDVARLLRQAAGLLDGQG